MASPTSVKRPLEDEEQSAIPEKVIRFEEGVKSEDEPAAISKSGRVRKKSAKVLEMEEAEEMERIVARMPKATPKGAKKGKKEPGTPAAPPSTIKTLLSGTPSKPMVQRENSLEALQAQLSKGGFLLDPPPGNPPPSSKKAKPKKAAAAATVGGLMVDGQMLETELKDEAGNKLKLLLTQQPGEPVLEAAALALAEPSTSQPEPSMVVVEAIPKTPKKKRSRKDSEKPAVVGVHEDAAALAPTTMEEMVLFQGGEESEDAGLDLSTESGSELDVPLVIDTVGTVSKFKKKGKKERKTKGKVDTALLPVSTEVLTSPGSEQDLEDMGVAVGEVAMGELPVYANTQAMGMKLMTSSERKANKKKPKKTKKEEETEKQPKKKRAPTAYMMWCNTYRPRVVSENPGIDFAAISRRLGEIWQALGEKEKMTWKMKAKRAANKAANKAASATKGSTLISTGKALTKSPAGAPGVKVMAGTSAGSSSETEPVASASGTQVAVRTAAENPDVYMYKQVVGTSPVDAAAHLKLLGESLSIIGARLQEHQGQIAVQGSLSVLLDSLLCALGPLVCLTNQMPQLDGCPAEVHSSTLDNIAYFMPGIG